MKLMINTASTFKGGGVQVAYSFIEECRKHSDHEYIVVLSKMLYQLVDRNLYPGNFSFHELNDRPATRVMKLQSPSKDLVEIEKAVQPDVVFTTSGPAYWRPKNPHLVGYNLPHYIYPESPFFKNISFAQKTKWKLKGNVLRYYFKREADAFVVQTDDIRDRLMKWVGCEEVYTISNTAGRQYFKHGAVQPKLPERENGEFRFVSLTSWYSHKNLAILNRVIPELVRQNGENIRFVLTIPKEDFETNFTPQAQQYILNTGPVPPSEGPSLYKECDAMFLPTLLECFSASYAEAMITEKPIATSDLGFARTVCRDAAIYFDPLNPGDIAKKLLSISQDLDLQESLIEKGKEQFKTFLTAKQRCETYLKICERLADEKK